MLPRAGISWHGRENMTMPKLFAFALLFFPANLKSELTTLVETELAFARLSIAKGTREAFLANLNDDSVLFRPQAVPGKSWIEKSPPTTAQLSWEPAFADVAKTADLGYTTGPWELRRTSGDLPSAFGHYVTVWKKQTDGVWKIAIDIGISHPKAPRPARVESVKLGSEVQRRRPEIDIRRARERLLEAERRFPASTEAQLKRFADNARVYRNDSFPFVGLPSIRRSLTNSKGTFTWSVIGAKIADSADFGYAYGRAEFKLDGSSKPTEKANYLRIWKLERNGEWKVVLDLVS
jgi:ketosteroid isomerase-like protein